MNVNEKVGKAWIYWYARRSPGQYLPFEDELKRVATELGIELVENDLKDFGKVDIFGSTLLIPFVSTIPPEILQKFHIFLNVLKEAFPDADRDFPRDTLERLLPKEWEKRYSQFLLHLIQQYGSIEKVEYNERVSEFVVHYSINNEKGTLFIDCK